MTTAYTSLLGLALPVTGELQGTWGDVVNNSITLLLDSAIAGTTTISTDGDVTLTTTTGASNQAREAIILCSGARTAQRTITAPAQSKIYTIINNTTGGYAVKLVGTGPTTGITVVAGESALVAWNGSDFIKISNTGGSASFTNVTVSGTTTLSGLTASTALALDASKNVVSVTNTGTGNNVLSASPTLTGTIGAAALTLSSDLTLSGGTANGVLYLNGSKVATSGSALTFDGTGVERIVATSGAYQIYKDATPSIAARWALNTGFANAAEMSVYNGTSWAHSFTVDSTGYASWVLGGSEQMRLTSTGLGIGTSSPGAKLQVAGTAKVGEGVASNTAKLMVNTISGVAAGIQLFQDSNESWIIQNPASTTALTFSNSGAERMRLDGLGNLGIGTSSPGAKLDVRSGATTFGAQIFSTGTNTYGATTSTSLTNSNFQLFGGGASGATTGIRLSQGGSFELYFGGVQESGGAGAFVWQGYSGSAYAERMRLDSSGNLGLGVTPSAWGSILKPIQLGNAFSYVAGRTDGVRQVWLGSNSYYNGTNWIYGLSSPAAQYYQNDGIHIWNTAPSGTAGTAISFTQAMTLDASGQLGIQAAIPRGLLDLNTTRQVKIYMGTAGTIGETQAGAGDYIANNLYVSAESAGTMTYTKITGDNGNAVLQDYSRGITFYTGVTGANTTTGTLNDFERMRLDSSGNLGIGTSSPGQKLTVQGGVNVTSSATLPAAQGSMLFSYESAVNRCYMGDGTGYSFAFSKRSASTTTDLMTLTDTGNLGLGVTPSAWSTASSRRAIQLGYIGGAAVFTNAAGNTLSSFVHGAYENGTNWLYAATNVSAGRYEITGANAGSVHAWYVSAGGTAGNAITFTQAMTLDASGNLLVGTTALAYGTSGRTNIAVNGTTTSFVEFQTGGVGRGYLAAASTNMELGAVGYTSFVTGGAERARIDSSGNLLVGTTNTSATAGVGLKLQTSPSVPQFAIVVNDSGTSTNLSVYNTNATAYRFYVNNGGTIFATSTTISAISDQRFKENVRDLDVGLDAVMALKPRKFDWKTGKGKDIKNDRGFIAQEFEQVFPDLIDEWKDPAPEGEEPYKSVRQDLIPVLVKAIQEQQALITDLRARVAQLEAKG